MSNFAQLTESPLMTGFKAQCHEFCERQYGSGQYVNDVEELFKMCDKDKDGRIYADEFKQICIKIDNTMEDRTMCKLFNELNSQKLTRLESIVFSEYISKDEFKRFFKNNLNRARFDAIKHKFDSFDKNHDGSISLEEFCKDILAKLGLDINGDGKISFNEFRHYYTVVSKACKTDDDFFKYMDNTGLANILYNVDH